jgi:HEAT repeat protein
MSDSDANEMDWADLIRRAGKAGTAEREDLADEVAAMGFHAREGLEPLIRTLRDAEADPADRLGAAVLLGFVGTEVAVEPLVQAVLDESGTAGPLLKWEAGESLRRISDTAVPALIESLTHYSADIRKIAAFALGVIGPAARPAVPELRRLLKDPRPALRKRAAQALAEIGDDTGGVSDDADGGISV